MAEKRFHNKKRAVASFDENERFNGVLQPGRYRGYDTFIPSGLTFTLAHDNTGIEKTLIDLSLTDKTGILYTTQGGLIHEDEAVGAPFVVGTNALNAFTRIDLIIYEHEYLDSPGGQAGIYSILQGPNGGPVEPTLSAPEKQIIVGRLEIPASATNLNNANYIPARTPGIGNFLHAGLDQWNKFLGLNEWSQCSASISSLDSLAVNRKGISVPHDGNVLIMDVATVGFDVVNGIRPKPDGAAGTLYKEYQPGMVLFIDSKADFSFGDWRAMPLTNALYELGYREIENPVPSGGIGFWGVLTDEKLALVLVDTGEVDRPHKFRIVAHEGAVYRGIDSLSNTVSTILSEVQPAWTAVTTFGTDYAAGSPVPQVKFDFTSSFKRIVFGRGRISRTVGLTLSGSTPVHICTVPTNYKPSDTRYFVLHSPTGVSGTSNIAQGFIDNTGKVYVIPNSINTGFLGDTDSISFEIIYPL